MTIVRWLARAALTVLLLAVGVWAGVALVAAGADGGLVRRGLAAALACLTVAAGVSVLLARGRRWLLPVFAVAVASTLVW
ncbi:MAG: hypothetical protein ACREEG_13535, partial [Phenylobacterium sp.]